MRICDLNVFIMEEETSRVIERVKQLQTKLPHQRFSLYKICCAYVAHPFLL